MHVPHRHNRTKLPRITSSGRRNGAYRLITGVDLDLTDATALRGDAIAPARQVDLPINGLLVSSTPSGAAKNYTSDWRYVRVPQQNTPFQWSDPVPDSRFLDFRDAVATEFLHIPTPGQPRTHIFPPAPGNRPAPSQAITNARDLYLSISTALRDPGITGISYTHADRGFAPTGTPGITARTLLRESSDFVAWAFHPCPAFTLPNLSWQNNALTLTITEDDAFEASHGINPAQLLPLAETPRVSMNISILLQQVYDTIPDLILTAWQTVEENLKPQGFALRHTSDPAVKQLVPQGDGDPG